MRLRTYVDQLTQFSSWVRKPTSTFSTTKSIRSKLISRVDHLKSAHARVMQIVKAENSDWNQENGGNASILTLFLALFPSHSTEVLCIVRN